MMDPAQWRLFQQAYEIGNQVVDLVKNHKTDAALLGLLAAVAMLRRKTTMSADDVLERLRSIDSAVDLVKAFSFTRPTGGSNG